MLAASLGGNEESQHRQEREKGTLSTGVKSAANVSVNGLVFLRIRIRRRRRRRRSNVSLVAMTSPVKLLSSQILLQELPGWHFKIQSLLLSKIRLPVIKYAFLNIHPDKA